MWISKIYWACSTFVSFLFFFFLTEAHLFLDIPVNVKKQDINVCKWVGDYYSPDMAAIPRGVHNRDCVRLQLLLDLPWNHRNRNESVSRHGKRQRRNSYPGIWIELQKIRIKKLNRGGKGGTLASSAFVAADSADPAGPGADAQAANPLVLGLLEWREGDQVVVGQVEGWEERADEA